MENILGITGNGFVMLASDTIIKESEMFRQTEVSKIHRLTDHSMLTLAGVGNDSHSLKFKNKILRHLGMFKVHNDYDLGPAGVLHYIRNRFNHFKRGNTDNKVTMLIAGFDHTKGPELHCIDNDNVGTFLPCIAHGSSAEFCNLQFQRLYKPNLDRQAAHNILKDCIAHIQEKNACNFEISVIDKNGVTKLEPIKSLKIEAPGQSLAEGINFMNF